MKGTIQYRIFIFM